MLHCYATGKMSYLSNKEAFSSSTLYGVAHFAAWSVIVPIFRELHFYFAHRLIHLRALYTYVHSVHHRNTDVEPFSGLPMYAPSGAYVLLHVSCTVALLGEYHAIRLFMEWHTPYNLSRCGSFWLRRSLAFRSVPLSASSVL